MIDCDIFNSDALLGTKNVPKAKTAPKPGAGTSKAPVAAKVGGKNGPGKR